MRHRWAIWVPPQQSASKHPSAVPVRTGVLVRLAKLRAVRLAFPLYFQTGLAKGAPMSSEYEHPVVYVPAQTALAHTGQPRQYLDVRQLTPDEVQQENQEQHLDSHPNVCLEGAT